ncbi:MAG: ASCH domain-containing protein [Candidatus Caldarchaeum sp.]|nr:ASCH domain-containing protein [Candidatus Caldarchaeum sp.]
MDGLIVKQPFANKIISGRKKRELRLWPPPVKKMNRNIYLLSNGYALGIIKIVGAKSLSTRAKTLKLKSVQTRTVIKYRYAWFLKVVKKFRRPVRYSHPRGAQIWVKDVKLIGSTR